MTQSSLCSAMNVDANYMVLMLNDLESSGYVERRRDPADRRRHIVELTSAGHEAIARAERAMDDMEDDVLGSLSTEERATLRDLLDRAER
jgi:DNA-binding MarR family transcriptional regulator